MQSLYVIKIGGNVIDHDAALSSFLMDFASIEAPAILVHGGGQIASKIGMEMGITPKYHEGRRITDDATIDLVTMVYGGLINKQMVARLQSMGCNAIGLSGADANLIPATRRPAGVIDYGWAGDVTPGQISTDTLCGLLALGLKPVVAPLTHDSHGHILNTNADTIASCLAIALSGFYTVRLVYCFEKAGVLLDVEDDTSLISLMDRKLYGDLKAQGKLFKGILPKLDNAFAAIEAGVNEVLIGHAMDIIANTGSNGLKGTLIH